MPVIAPRALERRTVPEICPLAADLFRNDPGPFLLAEPERRCALFVPRHRPAMVCSQSSSPDGFAVIPRATRRSLGPPSSASLRAKSLRDGRHGASNRHQGPRSSRGPAVKEITMAQIGTFTRDADGSFTGTIKTLTLNIKARLVPAEASQNEKAPEMRVLSSNVEIGAAWKRTSRENSVYLSVKLDDPSFTAPIYANLVEVEGGYALVWTR
jgi:uncharacterized protein (DUF736 family)